MMFSGVVQNCEVDAVYRMLEKQNRTLSNDASKWRSAGPPVELESQRNDLVLHRPIVEFFLIGKLKFKNIHTENPFANKY